jgi:hypothetical protein
MSCAGVASGATRGAAAQPAKAKPAACRKAKAKHAKRHARCAARRAPKAHAMDTTVTNSDITLDDDFGDTEFDPCTGEAFLITGHEHIVIHDSTSSSTPPGIHEMQITLDVHGQGTGDLSGATYVIDDYQMQNVQIPGPPNTTSTTIDFYYKAVRQGEVFDPILHTALVDDFAWHTLLHMTFNAAGAPTAFVTKGDPLTACH